MRVGRVSIVALALLALLPSSPTARAGGPEWLRVSTPNFVVYCDAGEKRARELAERLEGFRALLVSLFPKAVASSHAGRVAVIAFKNDADFTPYKPIRSDAKPVDIAGQFFAASEQTMILLDVSSFEGSSHVVFHEYVHHLFAGSDTPVPLWFDEGVAEFYSTATTVGAQGQIGKIIKEHVALLRERGPMPLATLFATSQSSPEYNESDRQGLFYATSWALVHYCVLDATGARSTKMRDFAERQGRGEPVADAFKATFGGEPAALEKELESYTSQNSYPLSIVSFPAPLEVATVAPEKAPPVEVEYFLGEALALEQRFDEADTRLRRAAELDPASVLPHEALGFVAVRRGDMAAATAAFAEASKRDSNNYLALYYLAVADVPRVDRDETVAASVRARLERVVALRPDFEPPYGILAQLAFNADDAKASASWAERGLAVDARDGRLRSSLALAEMRLGDLESARTNLRRVVDTSTDAGARAYAKAMLESVERRLAAPK